MDLKTWYKCKFKNKVILRTITDSTVESVCKYEMTEELIDRDAIPVNARKCRGEPYCWSLNLIQNKLDGHDIDGFSGSNAWSWLHTDAYDNLLSGLWKEGDHINMKKILVILGVVSAILIGAYIVFRGKI